MPGKLLCSFSGITHISEKIFRCCLQLTKRNIVCTSYTRSHIAETFDLKKNTKILTTKITYVPLVNI